MKYTTTVTARNIYRGFSDDMVSIPDDTLTKPWPKR